MDITVENITDLELPADLEAAILAKLEPKVSPFLTGKGFVVKPQTEYDTEIKTASETAVKKAVGEESATLYGRIDSLVAIALGETKPDKMRTRDWVEQLEKEGKLPLSEAQLTKIRDSINGTSQTKDAVVEGLKKKLEESDNARQKDKTEAFNRTVKTAVNADLRNAPVLVDPNLKDATAISTAKTAAISDLKELFNALYEPKQDEETGEFYFVKKGTDKALMNATENRPMTPTEIIRANHPMYLAPVGHQQQGGGTGKSAPSTEGGFKTLSEITRYAIQTKGFAAYSKEFNDFVAKERQIAGL